MGIKLFFILILLSPSFWAKERIVSLSPSITEIIYALGVGKDLVATSTYSLYPKDAQKLPTVGSYTNPNIEKILSFHPTVVIGEIYNKKTLEKLKYFHIKTISLKLKTITSIKKSITTLAKALNKDLIAKKLIQDIDNAIKSIKKSNRNKKVMIVYGLHEDLRDGIYIAGDDIFFNDIIKLCGDQNVYTDKTTSQPVLTYEGVIALNPDIIIILYSKESEKGVNVQKAIDAWNKLPTTASREHKIFVIDDDYIYIPSHRIALSIKRIAKEIQR